MNSIPFISDQQISETLDFPSVATVLGILMMLAVATLPFLLFGR